nr:hypothetical protein Ade03nite_93140 [Actinoplanes derwentensis]
MDRAERHLPRRPLPGHRLDRRGPPGRPRRPETPEAEAKVQQTAAGAIAPNRDIRTTAVGQQRLFDLAARGEVLDDNLHTTPSRFGGGAATTWLFGTAAEVALSLRRYQALGISHFVLSDAPYLPEIKRQGDQLLPLLGTDV